MYVSIYLSTSIYLYIYILISPEGNLHKRVGLDLSDGCDVTENTGQAVLPDLIQLTCEEEYVMRLLHDHIHNDNNTHPIHEYTHTQTQLKHTHTHARARACEHTHTTEIYTQRPNHARIL